MKVTWHFAQRMVERGVNPKEVYDSITKGTKYSDPNYPNTTVYFYNKIAVVLDDDGSLITIYIENNGKPKRRWKKK